MNDIEQAALLDLCSIPGIGSGRLRNLIAAMGSAQAVLAAPLQRLIRVPGIERITAVKIKNEVDKTFTETQRNFISQYNIKIISFWQNEYPTRLKKIYDPPALLFVKGELCNQDQLAVGIVGTRMPSHYGRVITEQFSKELVHNKFTIVSGLARGVDTIAHQTALRSGGRTIAVMGSGFDQIYPPENIKLVERISEQGAVISEYPIGTKPDAGNFPRRNRIISGLSLGVLITEAGIKSGALITAFQALEQDREVFAVPGPITSGKSSGANHLLKEGATMVQCTSDIVNELAGQMNKVSHSDARKVPQLKGLEKDVYELLSDEPCHVDVLVQKTKKTSPEVLTVLLTLELMGIVKQLSGKCFIRY